MNHVKYKRKMPVLCSTPQIFQILLLSSIFTIAKLGPRIRKVLTYSHHKKTRSCHRKPQRTACWRRSLSWCLRDAFASSLPHPGLVDEYIIDYLFIYNLTFQYEEAGLLLMAFYRNMCLEYRKYDVCLRTYLFIC